MALECNWSIGGEFNHSITTMSFGTRSRTKCYSFCADDAASDSIIRAPFGLLAGKCRGIRLVQVKVVEIWKGSSKKR